MFAFHLYFRLRRVDKNWFEMKIFTINFIIFEIYILNCVSSKVLLPANKSHLEVAKFLRKIIKDWNIKHSNEINDIAIMNMDNDTSIFHGITKGIPKINPILLPEFSCTDTQKYFNLRECSLFIIISRAPDVDKVS